MAQDQFFSAAEGGVVCPRHAGLAASLTPITMLALKLLRNLQRSRFEQITALDVAPTIHNDAERVMGQYLAYVLERRLDTADLLRRLRRD